MAANANANANAANNNPLRAIQTNVLAVTADENKEAAWKVLPGASARELPANLVKRFQDKLVEKMREGYTAQNPGATNEAALAAINQALIDNGAIISGGFILRSLGLYTPPTRQERRGYEYLGPGDIDFYVPVRNIVPFYQTIRPWFGLESLTSYKSTEYCRSFLRRNGIRRVYKFSDANVDIMSVRNKRNVTDVVQNFDLTFCQNWYDGRKLFSTHPEHLDHRIGYLQGDYVPLFLSHNTFLRSRCRKYTQRGFEIRLDPKAVFEFKKGMPITTEDYLCGKAHNVRDELFFTRWACKALFQFITTKIYDVRHISKSTGERVPRWKDAEGVDQLYPDDGYDSDDYAVENPTQEEKERLLPKFKELATRFAASHDPTLEPLTQDEKFWQLNTRFISYFYSDSKYSPFVNAVKYDPENGEYYTEEEIQEVLALPTFLPYIAAIKNLYKRVGMDPVTLDDTEVYDFHAHTEDMGASKDALNGLLQANVNTVNKNEIPCYAEGCGRYLTKDNLRPFADPQTFITFVNTVPTPPQLPLGALTDWGALLRNVPKMDPIYGGEKGGINKHTMCPFCLKHEERAKGCAYMQHAYDVYDAKKAPYCSPAEQVKSLWQKYKDYQEALPRSEIGAAVPLEFCAICGRPCHGHAHFDLANPGRIIKAPVQGGQIQYGFCLGGGRAEMIARMLAVRQVIHAHKDDAEPDYAAIRSEAAYAADAAPLDAALMARAQAIFAQEAATRKFNNVGINEYSGGPGGAAPPAPGDEEAKVPEEDDVVVPVEVPNAGAEPNPLLAALQAAMEEQGGPAPNWMAGVNPGNFANNNVIPNINGNAAQGGGRRVTRGRRKSAMKKRLRTQRNSRR